MIRLAKLPPDSSRSSVLQSASLAFLLLFFVLQLSAQARKPQTVRVLDVLRVRANTPALSAILTLPLPEHPDTISCDVLVVGASTGGVAAALAAARGGHSVCLTEETNWIGGQMTAQGVSAFDENRFIEPAGGTASYLQLRQEIRSYYKHRYTLSQKGASEAKFNPGNCWVDGLCFEPPVALQILNSMLAPYQAKHLLHIFLRTKAVSVHRTGNHIDSVLAFGFESHRWINFKASYFLDATDLGELLPLSGTGYVTGAESRGLTGEPDAPLLAAPSDDQSLTYTFVLTRDTVHSAHVPRPADYELYSKQQPYTLKVNYGYGKSLRYLMFAKSPATPGSFWSYRRLTAADNFAPSNAPQEFSMINWDANDTCVPEVLSSNLLREAEGLQRAKRIAFGFAYWLQNDVPRDDNSGTGYPALRLVPAELGSHDGLSQFPYIRESRRIQALETVTETQISALYQKGVRAAPFNDSVGIGFYAIDIHGCTKNEFTSKTKPFQIPLGTLIPRHTVNLLAASKNIGTTHITNGAYRLHPIEWAIGEAAGTLADFAIDHHLTPQMIYRNPSQIKALQLDLLHHGAPTFWFDDLPATDPAFLSVQSLATYGIFGSNDSNLHFHPDAPVQDDEAVSALVLVFRLDSDNSKKLLPARRKDVRDEARLLIARGFLASSFPNAMNHDLTWQELKLAEAKTGVSLFPPKPKSNGPTRAEFSVWLEKLYAKTATWNMAGSNTKEQHQ